MKRHQRIKPSRKVGIGSSWRIAPRRESIISSIVELLKRGSKAS